MIQERTANRPGVSRLAGHKISKDGVNVCIYLHRNIGVKLVGLLKMISITFFIPCGVPKPVSEPGSDQAGHAISETLRPKSAKEEAC